MARGCRPNSCWRWLVNVERMDDALVAFAAHADTDGEKVLVENLTVAPVQPAKGADFSR